MPHQDRQSQGIVVNHQVLWEAMTWLFPAAFFARMPVRKGRTWKPRMQAVAIDRRRWGIELYFRTFKQTFQKTKLRSRSAAHAVLEKQRPRTGPPKIVQANKTQTAAATETKSNHRKIRFAA